MAEIRCPKCGEVFQVDESGYAQIVKQVRDKEFEEELHTREADMESRCKKEFEVLRLQDEKAHAESLSQKEAKLSEKDKKIAELQAKLDAAETEKKLAVSEAVEKKNDELSKKTTEIVDLKGKLKSTENEKLLSEK